MRPSKGRISLWPAALTGFGLVLAVLSISPTLQLKAVPPSDFVEMRVSAAAPQTRLAAAYWDVAVRVIQWKYHRGNALPEHAPEDFRLVHDTDRPAIAEVRIAYWAKLREEWLRPENWQASYDLDWSWPVRNIRSVSREFLGFINQT